MSEQTQAAAPVADAEAAAITAAVETALAVQRAAAVLTPAEKVALATGIYTTWRNANLRGVSVAAFAQVEAASSALITAIAAQL